MPPAHTTHTCAASASPHASPLVLVLGATGKTGSLVADGLRARGVAVRRAARSLPDGPGTARFDWHRPATWGPALAGATALYVVTPMEPAFPARLVDGLVDRATAEGVRRVVLLSGLSAGYGSPVLLDRERPVRASALEWTVLRPGGFSQNFSAEPHVSAVLGGELRLPLGPGPGAASAFIDVRDIADVAVATLVEPGHNGLTHLLTGPRALTFGAAMSLIGEATGRHVRYVDVPLGLWTAEQRAAGVPDDAVAWSLETFAAMRRGAYAEVHDGVRRVLGREPRGFEAYVRDGVRTAGQDA
ncbi:NAD(P)H-binding protein [Streptomyces sp. NPDC003032]